MASAKYTKGAKGSYQARVWDGTYDEHGRKHRMVSKVSGTMKYDRGQKKTGPSLPLTIRMANMDISSTR